MNLTVFSCNGTVFVNCECIKGYAFKMVAPRGKSAHLEAFRAPRTAYFTALQDNCAHFDRIRFHDRILANDLSLLKYAS